MDRKKAKYGPVMPGTFQFEWTRVVAIASLNDCGTANSLKLMRGYLDRVNGIVADVRIVSQERREKTEALKSALERMKADHRNLQEFFAQREKFKGKKTSGFVQWVTKQGIRIASKVYLDDRFHSLTHRMRHVHSEVCSILDESDVTPYWDVH